jgi:hypothetical protein
MLRGRGGPILLCVLVFLGFRGSSIGVMVGQMLMVLLRIMVFQYMPLLVRGVADISERLVESKLLE